MENDQTSKILLDKRSETFNVAKFGGFSIFFQYLLVFPITTVGTNIMTKTSGGGRGTGKVRMHQIFSSQMERLVYYFIVSKLLIMSKLKSDLDLAIKV